MKKKAIVNTTPTSPFEAIKKMEAGREYWTARDLQKLLSYREWRKFEDAIERAMIACKNSKQEPSDHFVRAATMINTGKGAKRQVTDYRMSRYACYLVAMNSDPRKQEVSDAQTYFAVMTRVAETVISQPILNSLWEQRLDLFHKHTKIPHGYWCVFGMVAGYCRSDEFRNVHLVENALPDGSVGKRWCQHLRERGYDMSLLKEYPHIFPDHRGRQMAFIYPNELLGEFWTWFNATYLVEHYPTYLKGRLASDEPRQIDTPNK
jgi:hypothetical protein